MTTFTPLVEEVMRAQLELALRERDEARRELHRLETNVPRFKHCPLCGAVTKQPYCYAHRWALL